MISVVIPVYNTGTSAEELVQRLLSDKYQDFEIILVDDGSSDDSLARLRKLASQDKRIRVVAQKNAGASAARNAGINISRGEYICFIDSDDLVAKNYSFEMVGAMEAQSDLALVVCGERYKKLWLGRVDDVYISPFRKRRSREKLGDYVILSMIRDGRMYGSVNKIFRAEVVREMKTKFEVGRDFAEDTSFVLRYLVACLKSKKYSSGDISFVLKPLYIYNAGTETSTVQKSGLKWKNWERQYRDTVEFAKKSGGVGLKTRALLAVLRLRWRVSHYRSVKRARGAKKARGES